MQASFHFERRNFQEIIFRKFDEFCASEYINYLKSSIVKLWNQQTVFPEIVFPVAATSISFYNSSLM